MSLERIDASVKGFEMYMNLRDGKKEYLDKGKVFYKGICQDIETERKRLGGDWVIAQGVPSRQLRDFIREQLGDTLIFVTLTLSEATQIKRIKSRHGDNPQIIKMFVEVCKNFEPAQRDEIKAHDILINEDMDQDDVMARVLELVN